MSSGQLQKEQRSTLVNHRRRMDSKTILMGFKRLSHVANKWIFKVILSS